MIVILIVMWLISLIMLTSFGFMAVNEKDGLIGLAAMGWLMSLVMITWRIGEMIW